jgi:hypothetical protein
VRAVEIVVLVVFVIGFAALVRAAWRSASTSRLVRGTAWEPHHRFEDGVRRVYVRRGAELEPVGEVAPADPDYDSAFLALMDRARERASVLNSER